MIKTTQGITLAEERARIENRNPPFADIQLHNERVNKSEDRKEF